MKKIIAVVSIAILSACSQPDTAKRVLEQNGYTDVKIEGWAIFGCSKDDTFATKFKAKSTNGKDVEGVVCGGVFKGNTIRLD